MKYIVDRIEGDLAVLEDKAGRHCSVPLSRLSEGVHDGACLNETDGVFTPDPARERKRRRRMAEKLRNMMKEQR